MLLLRSSARAVKQPHRRAQPPFSTTAAQSNRDHHHASPTWSSSRKQLVEALTQGSSLARAPCAWYVDHGEKHSLSSGSVNHNNSHNGNSGGYGGVGEGGGSVSTSAGFASTAVMRVNARQTPVSHAALAHAESSASDALRAELERHLRTGGATVLITPIVDPLIMDLAALGGKGAFPVAERMTGDEDDDGEGLDFLLSRSVDYDGSTSPEVEARGGAVLVEGTVCKCDPDDPGDCCARDLATYSTTCPTYSACEPNTCPVLASVDGAAPLGAGGSGCAFAQVIKAVATTHTHRHQYYAAIVQTTRGGGGIMDGDDGVEYEEFLVHRPNGDSWIAGALPPPTSVRRASFGPQLRGELRRLAVEQQGQ